MVFLDPPVSMVFLGVMVTWFWMGTKSFCEGFFCIEQKACLECFGVLAEYFAKMGYTWVSEDSDDDEVEHPDLLFSKGFL